MSAEWAEFPDADSAPARARQWNVSPTSVRFFLFMRFATASCSHEAADLACRAIRVEARANGEVTAHCACTLRACSNRTACTSAGHRTCAAHANAPFQRRSPRRRPAMNGESSHACRAPRRCFRSDYAAHTGRSRRAAARGTFAHMRCAPTRNAAHLRKRAVRRSCALALLCVHIFARGALRSPAPRVRRISSARVRRATDMKATATAHTHIRVPHRADCRRTDTRARRRGADKNRHALSSSSDDRASARRRIRTPARPAPAPIRATTARARSPFRLCRHARSTS